MTKTTCLALLVLALLALASSAELPIPPEGYAWSELGAIKAALLVPNGWHMKHQGSGDKNMWAISKENIDQKGYFETGLTFISTQNVSTKPQGKVPPSKFADAMLKEMKNTYPLERESSGPQGPFYTVRYQYIDAPKGKTAVRIYNLLMANDQTGTLYQVIFEAPLSEWDKAWEIGEQILKKILVDDEV